MSRSVMVLSSAPVTPAEFLDVVGALGGEKNVGPDGTPSGTVERDEGLMLVYPFEPDTLPYGPDLLAAYGRVLGSPPRSRAVVEVSSDPGSEWLAAEYVLAAAERWPVAVDDFGEQIVGIEEFQRRLAKRPSGFFLPDAWYDPSPAAARRDRVVDVTLLLPGTVEPAGVTRLVRSLGGQLDPDDRTDALLERGAARVWLRAAGPGEAPVDPGKIGLHREVLGEPPYNSVALEVFDTAESQTLAAELVEAAAAHWPVLVRGVSGQVMTVGDVRDRVAAGAVDVLDP
ncbi:hypothetical protein [Actinomadura sp. K4S16]|uniref:hypothetical protein n=1 Tax=Actinomadura sp. K4S16 TaxID=1316147 RepID=UPI0011EEAA5F|nr:hypothetical protein [Actinomadura sp. K4S16]